MGLVSGIVNTICIITDALVQMAFGLVLDAFWQGRHNPDGTRQYGFASYMPALLLLSGLFFVAVVSSLAMRRP